MGILTIPSSIALRNWIMILNTVDEESSLVQRGTNISFMVHPLIEGSENAIKLNFIKIFKVV